MDFRLATSELVTASDASTTGGGLCVTREVEPEEMDQALVVSLFDG